MSPRRYGVGDIIFFHWDAQAKWHVEGNVKKIAFLRLANPAAVGLVVRAANKLKRMFLITRNVSFVAAWFMLTE